jgi:phosphatidylglycerol:prolipoprotein diacylglycerol transferase
VVIAFVLPLVTLDKFDIGPFTIDTFAVLIGIGVITGFWVAVRRAAKAGISREQVALFTIFMFVGGFVGARIAPLFYLPDLLSKGLTDPYEVFVRYHGISSFGAYGGGLIGAMLFFRLHGKSLGERLQLLDALGFALPVESFFGRLGCALVHDHRGIRSDGWFAVAFPDGARYDLGLLEAMFLFLLAMVFLILSRRTWRPGFYFALYACAYGTFRLLLDRLHEDPARYFGITVDQYCATIAILAGAVTFYLSGSTYTQGSTPENIHETAVRSVSKP